MHDVQRADRAINHFEHHVLGFPSQRRSPVTPQGARTTAMVVAEKQQSTSLGIGENTFIDRDYRMPSGVSAFKAKQWKDGATSLNDFIDDDDVYVDPSMLSCVLFTGQLFLLSNDNPVKSGTVTVNGIDFDVKGHIVSGGLGNRWLGQYYNVTGPMSGTVDVNFFQQVDNPTASASRKSTCRVRAINATGTVLVDQQGVTLDYMATNPGSYGNTTATYNRWQISDYVCPGPPTQRIA